jgi:hypothetical protein
MTIHQKDREENERCNVVVQGGKPTSSSLGRLSHIDWVQAEGPEYKISLPPTVLSY